MSALFARESAEKTPSSTSFAMPSSSEVKFANRCGAFSGICGASSSDPPASALKPPSEIHGASSHVPPVSFSLVGRLEYGSSSGYGPMTGSIRMTPGCCDASPSSATGTDASKYVLPMIRTEAPLLVRNLATALTSPIT